MDGQMLDLKKNRMRTTYYDTEREVNRIYENRLIEINLAVVSLEI
jgi:hypothetical protein